MKPNPPGQPRAEPQPSATVVTFRLRICSVAEGVCMLYPGDAGYPDSDPELAGTRHRLWARTDGMHYERSD